MQDIEVRHYPRESTANVYLLYTAILSQYPEDTVKSIFYCISCLDDFVVVLVIHIIRQTYAYNI